MAYWYDEISKLEKESDNTLFQISWEYTMPLWPLFKARWIEKQKEFSLHLYCDPGERLQHSNASVRIKEIRNACDYPGSDTDWNAIEQICTDQFIIAADLLKSKVFLSDIFVSELIQRIVREKWIFDTESAEYLLQFDISYF